MKLVEKKIFEEDEKSKRSKESKKDEKSQQKTYKIASNALFCRGSVIQVQSTKVKLFYFQSGSTQALLDCFKTQIAQNASEFRLLPDMDAVLKYHNYSEIFELRNEESINKFRGITGVELDKFALAKFLGKYRKVSGMIQSKEESVFEKDLMIILDERTLISNYGSWERLFEILILNSKYDLYKKLALRIIDALNRYTIPSNMCSLKFKTHDALLRVFLSALQRTAAIVWSKEIDEKLKDICKGIDVLRNNNRFSPAILTMFDVQSIKKSREAYCKTRMINKYLIPLPIDCVLDKIKDDIEINLGDLSDMLKFMNTSWSDVKDNDSYIYYPYMFTPHELSFALVCTDLLENKNDIKPDCLQNKIDKLFMANNYQLNDDDDNLPKSFNLENVISKSFDTQQNKQNGRDLFYTKVACNAKASKDKMRIAIGNVKLSIQNFEFALDGHPNRSYKRYKQFAKIINEVIHEKADMLVLPEIFLPFEWIPVAARLCANNNLALITGIEHFVVKDKTKGSRGVVYNLTATILPYKCDDYPFSSVSYHNKVAYSPHEKELISGRRFSYQEGKVYQLFGWHNVWFPTYCCYELASIHDRGLFQNYADMVVAVEWNKDVPYYSNIIESLSRDLHCYCIQSNSSDYGDSRIVAPKDSVSKDIVKTKGGLNACALIDEINIKALRDFQMLEYPLQKNDGAFKPSPPGIDPDGIIQKKRENKLFT